MSGPAGQSLASTIPAGASVLVDTSVVLAYLTGTEPTSARATQLFDAFIATGRNTAALSMITVGEILVRPFRRDPSAVATAESFLQHFGDLRLLPVDYDVAREGARIRALTDLAMPDALIVASARVAGVDILVTNDRAWQRPVATTLPDLSMVVLAGTT